MKKTQSSLLGSVCACGMKSWAECKPSLSERCYRKLIIRTGYLAVEVLVCVPEYARRLSFFTLLAKNLPNQGSVFNTASCELYVICLVCLKRLILFCKTHDLEDTGLPSTKNYVAMCKSLILNLLSEMISLLVVTAVSILHGIRIHIGHLGSICMHAFVSLKNICD